MSPSPPHRFEVCFEDAWPALSWCNTHVVLAVSGGADSVAMLRAAVTVKERRGGEGRLFAAHLNHGMRGDEADADAAWLKALCAKLGIPIEVGTSDVAAIADRECDGWEAAARAARYDFLRRTAEGLGARFVAVAHTADDQVETVLHRIIRGTGIAGLAGMHSVRPLSPSVALVRPMLAMRRHDLLDYLKALGQEYRIDATNEDRRFTRNRLRHELLPALREYYNADVDAAVLRLSAQAGESQQHIEAAATQLASDCVVWDVAGQFANGVRRVAEVRIDCQRLANQPELIVREICKIAWTEAGWPLQAMGFDEWQQLAAQVRDDSDSPAVCLPGGVRAQRAGQQLVLRRTGLP
jgi:tRNA(Ile)-lysidine synthase